MDHSRCVHTIRGSFYAGTKTIPSTASVHTQDLGAVSLTKRSYAAPISKVEDHISHRSSYKTGKLFVLARKPIRYSLTYPKSYWSLNFSLFLFRFVVCILFINFSSVLRDLCKAPLCSSVSRRFLLSKKTFCYNSILRTNQFFNVTGAKPNGQSSQCNAKMKIPIRVY